MLNVTRDILSKLDDDVLVKQRRFLKFLACLMFLGACFLSFSVCVRRCTQYHRRRNFNV